jgi:hypothetical protein
VLGDDDLDAIFSSSGDFTQLGTFDVSGESLEVYGIFTDASALPTMFEVGVRAGLPSFTCKTTDVATVRNKMSVVIGGTTYKVEDIEKVGVGTSVVWLKT